MKSDVRRVNEATVPLPWVNAHCSSLKDALPNFPHAFFHNTAEKVTNVSGNSVVGLPFLPVHRSLELVLLWQFSGQI